MDTCTISSPTPDLRLRLRLLKAAVVVPDLIISSLITFVLLVALPVDVAVGFLVGILVASIVVASGRAEGLAVRILHAARQPTPAEERRIAGPLRLVMDRCAHEDLQVLIGQGDESVSAAGRRHVILHRDLVHAHGAGRITDAEVAAIIAHGVGRLRLGQPRLDLLITLWTLPWDFLRGLAQGIGRHVEWIPLVQFAWQTRFVVGIIAVVIEAQAGRWPSPIIIGAFIAISYLIPRVRGAWYRQVTLAADRQVAGIGLAGPLAGFLRRLPRDEKVEDRLDLLTHASEGHLPLTSSRVGRRPAVASTATPPLVT